MNIGIVGHEAAKFTPETEAKARAYIQGWILSDDDDTVISGGCHLGGIDIWAIEEAIKAGKPYKEFLPANLTWSGGFKPRNIQIAKASDLVVCIVVAEYPVNYKGDMKFDYCYHCVDHPERPKHAKSGGCWTANYALSIGKRAEWIVI